MKVRVALAVLAALLVGAATGYAVGAAREDRAPAPQAASAPAEPLLASPSVPVDVIAPDPDDPPVPTLLELEPIELVEPERPGGDPVTVVVAAPVGWRQGFDGVSSHTFTDPAASDGTYRLTVEFIDDSDVASAMRRRLAELDSAEAQGNLRDLEVEVNRTDDGFETSYIDPGGYRRVGIERFYAGPDGRALVTVRGAGRERDRVGLDDLVSLVTSRFEVVQGP